MYSKFKIETFVMQRNQILFIKQIDLNEIVQADMIMDIDDQYDFEENSSNYGSLCIRINLSYLYCAIV
jgi:hypothetical protein